ncbi:MAG TPA: hypothetical protein DD381_06900 [Lentisphaeria bacterium]|nr:MAG: hypothetical protein A2X47_05395 [Lentisphaerae bacterium GWF2_38_69]HBM16051.1 hypothetical protein [Lentisphaeria bacterium]
MENQEKRENKDSGGTLFYLYCISDKKPDFEGAPDSDKLYTFEFKSFYPVLKCVSQDDFGRENIEKNINSIPWLEKYVRMHEAVIENVMLKGFTVIPFKFATVFYSKGTLSSFLEEYSQVLKSSLSELKNKEEWGIKIYCNNEKIENFIRTTNQQVIDFNNQILNATQGKAYFMKKKQQELIGKLVKDKALDYSDECYLYLKELAGNSKKNKLQPKELTFKDHEMVMNLVFLLDKSSVSNFSNAVSTLKSKYENSGLIIDITGPWAPYNFCKIGEL